MKHCLIFATCQGKYIGDILMTSPRFMDEYIVETLQNNLFDRPLDAEKIGRADLLIHQHVNDEKHPEHGTRKMRSLLRAYTVKEISFPYIYNSGIFPIFEQGNTIVGGQIIRDMESHGYSQQGIIENATCSLMIDFKLRERFWHSLAIMRDREWKCDIRVSDIIESKLSSEKLFYSQNHVTDRILFHVANEILIMLGMTPLPFDFKNRMESLVSWPLSPYEIKAHDLKWAEVCPYWTEYMKKCIELVFSGSPVA
jgi:hypothetical protein